MILSLKQSIQQKRHKLADEKIDAYMTVSVANEEVKGKLYSENSLGKVRSYLSNNN